MDWIILAIAGSFIALIALTVWLLARHRRSRRKDDRPRTLRDVFGSENAFEDWDAFG